MWSGVPYAIQHLAVFAQSFKQRNKPHLAKFVIFKTAFGFTHPDQVLDGVRLSNRNDHDATDLELGKQWAGGVFGSSGDDDAVKRCLFGQAKAAIGNDRGDIGQREILEDLTGLLNQTTVAVYRIDAACQFAEDRGLIAGAGASPQEPGSSEPPPKVD